MQQSAKIFALLIAVFVAFFGCYSCDGDANKLQVPPPTRRYLLYGVNVGEGFNLRRDVYMRIANVVRQLRERGLFGRRNEAKAVKFGPLAGHDFVLVLPPWFGLPHWRSRRAHRWSEFFDLDSMRRFVPLIEYGDFIKGDD